MNDAYYTSIRWGFDGVIENNGQDLYNLVGTDYYFVVYSNYAEGYKKITDKDKFFLRMMVEEPNSVRATQQELPVVSTYRDIANEYEIKYKIKN